MQLAIRTFVREVRNREHASSKGRGVGQIRIAFFGDDEEDLEEYLAAAYVIGLGGRASNEVDKGGNLRWEFEVFTEEEFVPASAESRAWALPADTAAVVDC